MSDELTSYGKLAQEVRGLRTVLAAVVMEYGHGKLEIPEVALEAVDGSALSIKIAPGAVMVIELS